MVFLGRGCRVFRLLLGGYSFLKVEDDSWRRESLYEYILKAKELGSWESLLHFRIN